MKLYLGNAVWRTEEEGHAQSMRLLVRELDKRGIEFSEGFAVGDALISRARSIAASTFLRSEADVFLSIDSDIWFRAEDAIALAEKAMEYDIVAALYMTRSLKTQPALMLPDEPVIFAADSLMVEAPLVSTGFMAVHRRVFEKLIARSEELAPTVPEGLLHPDVIPLCHKGWSDRGVDTSFWPFYWPVPTPWEGDGHMYESEDWAFCFRAKHAGFKIWLDPSIRLGHTGTTMFTLEDLLQPTRPAAAPMRLHRNGTGELEYKVLN